MRICPKIRSADAKEMSRQGELAFTMIEIALAIGVIGFALVAIIGILPAGMNVQKDNREDTLISQDAPYFLDAIRNGAVISNSPGHYVNTAGNYVYYNTSQSLDFLTNYVQSIQFVYVVNGSNSFTNTFPTPANPLTGAEIIGLLSTPQTNYLSPYFASNYFDTIAIVRALSGPATDQSGPSAELNRINSIMAFTYQMEVMISPFNSFAPATTNINPANLANLDANQASIVQYRYREATNAGFNPPNQPYLQSFIAAPGGLVYNLFEVRLRFSWPVTITSTTTNVGPRHQTYRTMIASPLVYATANGVNEANGGVGGWFFQPQTFTNTFPNGL
jgi:type II secretory pathway pseudopilin PulG